MTTTTYNPIAAVVAAMKDIKALEGDVKQQHVIDLFKPVFDKFPNMEQVGWIQYTPYFNDGDPCTFTVNGPMIRFDNWRDEARAESEDPDNWSEDDEFYNMDCEEGGWLDPGYSFYEIEDKAEREAKRAEYTDAFSDFAAVPESLLESLFGNYKEIKVNRDLTFVINDREHD